MAQTHGLPNRTFSLALLGIGYVWAVLFLITRGQMLLAAIFTLLPFVAMIAVDRRKIFILSLLGSVSLVGIPGIRVDPIPVGFLLQAAVLAGYALNVLMRQEQRTKPDAVRLILAVFLINMFITAFIRGFGFYRLGSDMIGGMLYVEVCIALLFFLYIYQQKMDARDVEKLFILMFFFSALPYVVQVLVVNFPSLFVLNDFFVFNKARVAYAIRDIEQGREGRYETVVNFSYFLICLGTILKAERKHWGLLLAMLGVLLLLMSGFRRYAVLSVFVFFMCSVLLSKRRGTTAIFWSVAGLIGVLMAYVTAPMLPHNVQRAIAFLPGIQIGSDALISTENSGEWRLELYKYCIEDIPNYWLVGKGLLMSLDDKLYQLSYLAMKGGTDPYGAFIGRNYHSGIFELILNQGVVGLLSFMSLALILMIRVWKHISKFRDESRLWKICVTLFSVCSALTLDYFLVRGEFQNFIAPFLLFFGLMVLALNAHSENLQKQAESAIQLDAGP